MFRIAICDNNIKICTWMKSTLKLYEEQITQSVAIDIFTTGAALYEKVKYGEFYNLIFMDVELNQENGFNGIDIGKYIREGLCQYDVQIVYISDKVEYAMELFQNHPFDFLIKPLDEMRLVSLLNKAIVAKLGKGKIFHFTVQKKLYQIGTDEIMFFTSYLRVIEVHTPNQIYSFYGRLQEIKEKVPKDNFILAHRSYLLNISYIKIIESDNIELMDGTRIPMSRGNRKMVKKQYREYEKNVGLNVKKL